MAALTAAEISRSARHLYRCANPVTRLLQRFRPRICPFEVVLEFLPPDASVLDAGCGAGVLLTVASASGLISRGVGVDVNDRAVATAQAVARAANLPLEFRVCPSSRDWPAGPFDVVTMVDLMHHVRGEAAQRALIAEAARRLREGGLLVYKDMCSRPLWRALCNRAHDLIVSREGIHYVEITTVESWAKAEGMALVAATDLVRCGIYGHELRVFEKGSADVESHASTSALPGTSATASSNRAPSRR